MKFTVRDEAGDEAAEHVAWYAARNARVAERLCNLMETVITQIFQKPYSFPLLEYGRNPANIRRARLKNFPLMIVYQVLEDEVVVVAVTHTSQRPGYWRSRLQT